MIGYFQRRRIQKQYEESIKIRNELMKPFEKFHADTTKSVIDTHFGHLENIAIDVVNGTLMPLPFKGSGEWYYDGQFYFKKKPPYVTLSAADFEGNLYLTVGEPWL